MSLWFLQNIISKIFFLSSLEERSARRSQRREKSRGCSNITRIGLWLTSSCLQQRTWRPSAVFSCTCLQFTYHVCEPLRKNWTSEKLRVNVRHARFLLSLLIKNRSVVKGETSARTHTQTWKHEPSFRVEDTARFWCDACLSGSLCATHFCSIIWSGSRFGVQPNILGHLKRFPDASHRLPKLLRKGYSKGQKEPAEGERNHPTGKCQGFPGPLLSCADGTGFAWFSPNGPACSHSVWTHLRDRRACRPSR